MLIFILRAMKTKFLKRREIDFGSEKIMYKAKDTFPQERKESGHKVQNPSKTNNASISSTTVMKQNPKRSIMLRMREIAKPRFSRYAK